MVAREVARKAESQALVLRARDEARQAGARGAGVVAGGRAR